MHSSHILVTLALATGFSVSVLAQSAAPVRTLPIETRGIDTTARTIATPIDRGTVARRAPVGPFDRKTYPGSNCKTDRGSESDDVSYSKGGIAGKANRYPVVVCPVPRDNTVNYDGAMVTTYVKGGDSGGMGCTLYSRSAFGHELDSDLQSTQSHDYATLEFRVTSSEESGYYYLLCNLRDGNTIYSYSVTEFTDTGYDL